MTQPKDIPQFKFRGFSGIISECSIIIYFPNENKSAIVICTQKKDYVGTSITNGFELILNQLCDEGLKGDHGEIFRNLLLDESKEENWIQKVRSKLLKNEKVSLDFYKLFKNKVITWLEVYPKGTGLINDSVMVQRVYVTKDGSPVWSNLLSQSYIEELGLKYEDVIDVT